MTDDIVTQLNNADEGANQELCFIAADEIERLREELEAAKSSISGFIQMLGEIGKP